MKLNSFKKTRNQNDVPIKTDLLNKTSYNLIIHFIFCYLCDALRK